MGRIFYVPIPIGISSRAMIDRAETFAGIFDRAIAMFFGASRRICKCQQVEKTFPSLPLDLPFGILPVFGKSYV